MNQDTSTKEPRFKGKASAKSHKNMSRIHGKDTSIETILRKALWKKGYRYRKNLRSLPGSPDIAITKYKIAIFCDSEFFHGKDWDELRQKLLSGANPDYWIPKIQRNIERDIEKDKKLRALGWRVLHFWGNDILHDTNTCVLEIEEAIMLAKIEEEYVD